MMADSAEHGMAELRDKGIIQIAVLLLMLGDTMTSKSIFSKTDATTGKELGGHWNSDLL